MTEQQHAYVDRVATYFSILGSSRAWSEILAWLMICDPPHQSQAQIQESLSLSAGTVSTQLRSLVEIEFAEPVRLQGERVQYYRLRPGAWQRVMTSEMGRIAALKELAIAGEDVLPAERPERITELRAVAEFFEREWPSLLARMNESLEKGTP
ncbi:GbsR/MarR family transcriptional regulator [Demequina pelophila]|uniref:GbsR/MarR family transcriptional regulator n=1 Tax=Demequina pelophila TaxID=1638984 RepID=UPI000786703D|nr:hypothetical protein [Demequina pelophila]